MDDLSESQRLLLSVNFATTVRNGDVIVERLVQGVEFASGYDRNGSGC